MQEKNLVNIVNKMKLKIRNEKNYKVVIESFGTALGSLGESVTYNYTTFFLYIKGVKVLSFSFELQEYSCDNPYDYEEENEKSEEEISESQEYWNNVRYYKKLMFDNFKNVEEKGL